MNVGKILALGIALSMLAFATPAAAHANGVETKTIEYVATNGAAIIGGPDGTTAAGVSIWCAPGGHNYAPIGPWSGDPDELEGWLFSGEPECAPGDVLTGNEESAVSGGAFIINDHLGDPAAIAVNDAISGANAPIGLLISMGQAVSDYQGGDDGCVDNNDDGNCDSVVIETCGLGGVVSADIPEHVPDHWQLTEEALKLMWGRVRSVSIDLTTNSVCVGLQGTITGTY